MVGISIGIWPALTCSSSTIVSIFFKTLNPSGNHEYMPAEACLIIPARSIKRWLAIFASAGTSFATGKKYFVSRIPPPM